ncbi:MAG TPA: hypothetical protein VI278_16990 [Nitrososphaeraceae archaeon]
MSILLAWLQQQKSPLPILLLLPWTGSGPNNTTAGVSLLPTLPMRSTNKSDRR